MNVKPKPKPSKEVISKLGEKGPQTRITCGPTVVQQDLLRVHRGLDMLKVSFWVEWYDETLLDDLDRRKRELQTTDFDSEVFIKEHYWEWNLLRSGTKHFNYRLVSGDVKLMINRRKAEGTVPTVRLEIGSLSAQANCFTIYEQVVFFLESHGAKIVKEHISEVHLAADFIGLDIKKLYVESRDNWIARSTTFSVFFKHWKLTGVSIGKGDLMMRIYDKVLELGHAGHKQEVFAELWGVEKYNDLPVTRVEYQLRRATLRQFSGEVGTINTVKDLLFALKSLWNYCTQDWSRFTETIVNRNHNQSKAKISEFWEAVQSVVWTGVHEFQRGKVIAHKDIDALRKQARGILMSICAAFGMDSGDIKTITDVAHVIIETDLQEFFKDQEEFIKRMDKKKTAIFNKCDIPF